jgi:hypothetical protein
VRYTLINFRLRTTTTLPASRLPLVYVERWSTHTRAYQLTFTPIIPFIQMVIIIECCVRMRVRAKLVRQAYENILNTQQPSR